MSFTGRRHVWVRREYDVTDLPGLVVEWLDDDRKARVMYVTDEGKVFTEVLWAHQLTVLDVQPNIGSAYG